jgi:hypothetical protein
MTTRLVVICRPLPSADASSLKDKKAKVAAINLAAEPPASRPVSGAREGCWSLWKRRFTARGAVRQSLMHDRCRAKRGAAWWVRRSSGDQGPAAQRLAVEANPQRQNRETWHVPPWSRANRQVNRRCLDKRLTVVLKFTLETAAQARWIRDNSICGGSTPTLV